MNNNSGGGSKKRPPSGRGDPNIRKPAASSKSNKQIQRPTPSPAGRAGKSKETTAAARNRDINAYSGNRTRNRPENPGSDKSGAGKRVIPKSKTVQKEKTAARQGKSSPEAEKKSFPKQNKAADTEKIPVPRLVTPPKEPVNPYIRKMRRVLLGTVTLLILIAICVGLSLTVFFKIDEITVEGKTRYDEEDIIAASMINKGDNLLLCDTSRGVEKIQSKFSYIEEVEINKKLFNKVNIVVTEAKPASAVEYNGKYIILSKSGKIIDIIGENKYGEKKYKDIPEILGANLKNVKLSSKIQYKDNNVKKYIDRIIENVSKYKIADIKTIDISDTSSIKLIKSGGFTIIIGTFENIEYKLRSAADILSKNVREDAKGTLDVSLASADGGKSYLKLGYEDSKVSSNPTKENSSNKQVSKAKDDSDNESSAESEESQEESVGEETSVSEDGDYTDGTYTDDGYTDDYTDDTYTDDGYTDDYTDDTYTDDGYTDDYTDDTYTDDGYTDDYTDDTYTDDGYTDDYTDDTYTDDGYTYDYTDDTYYE